MEIKPKAIIPLTAGEDLSEKEGFFVKLSSGKAILVTAATDKPFGVILQGADEGEMVSVAVCGGNAGTIHVAAGGTISAGAYCQLEAAGDVISDSAAGARVLCAIALEDAVDGQLMEALAITPVTYA